MFETHHVPRSHMHVFFAHIGFFNLPWLQNRVIQEDFVLYVLLDQNHPPHLAPMQQQKI